MESDMTQEESRLQEARKGTSDWKKWGPYLSERQWGTVREDYSEGGDAWNFFTHDQARSRAYRWGEDGIAGASRWPSGTARIQFSRNGSSASPTARATTVKT
jgi:hypothetical protein